MIQQDVNFVAGGPYYDAAGVCIGRPWRGLSAGVRDEGCRLVPPPLRADMMPGG